MPILTNLSDSKPLTLPNLEGLARLMDLLSNHFKVEIGVKLIDHHRQLADEKMLRDAPNSPIAENEEIKKVAHLADIFHRLPYPGASVFLKNLADNIVQSETILCSTTETPFTRPLASFFDKYTAEAIDYLFEHIGHPRHVRTIRNVINSKRAPKFNAELVNQIPRLISTCLQNKDTFIPGLSISFDLAQLDPAAFCEREDLIQALLSVWSSEFNQEPDVGYTLPMGRTRVPSLLLSIFKIWLETTFRVDILFSVIAIFRLLALFDEPHPPKDLMTQILRIVVNPIIVTSYPLPNATKTEEVVKTDGDTEMEEKLITPQIVELVNAKIWTVMAAERFPAGESHDALTIEMLQMTG